MRRKQLLVVVDEGQVLANLEGFSAKVLPLRHYGIHLFINVQNASRVPIEVLGNCDCVVAFKSVHKRDRDTLAGCMNLTADQSEHLVRLNPGECCCFLSRSGWNQSFLAAVPRLEFCEVDDRTIAGQSREFLSQFPWKPVDDYAEQADAGDGAESKLDEKAEIFLRDVLNQAHEFSSLTHRFQRAGIRSAAMQGRIIKKLAGEGYIRIWSLPVGRGRPLKLVEPTKAAFEEFGVSWKKGRGVLPTRAATELLCEKIGKLSGWYCQKEGMLNGKQVDLLCRDAENKLVTIEVAHSSGHEVHNALHCAACDEVRKHVVICTSKKTLEAVKKAFGEVVGLAGNERVELITLSQALSEGWMP